MIIGFWTLHYLLPIILHNIGIDSLSPLADEAAG
jgi:hypothetical protein